MDRLHTEPEQSGQGGVGGMLHNARQMAENIVLERRLGRNKALYNLLAHCKNIVELCQSHEASRAELHHLFLAQGHRGNRRYVEKGSDEYVLVCRYVFNHTDRTNAMRYACALRVAGGMELGYQQLEEWMENNGGVNALYFRRPLDARIIKTRTLYLSRSVEVPRDRGFTVSLRWRNDNSFEILEVKHAEKP